MDSELIGLEIRLLLLKYGRDAVMRAIAGATEMSVEELEALLAQKIHSRKSRKRKRDLKPEEFVESRQDLDPERKSLLRVLARRYTGRRFLSTWAEIDTFVRDHGGEGVQSRNRHRAWPLIHRVLARLPLDDLAEIEKENATREDKTDYEVLAGGILRAD